MFNIYNINFITLKISDKPCCKLQLEIGKLHYDFLIVTNNFTYKIGNLNLEFVKLQFKIFKLRSDFGKCFKTANILFIYLVKKKYAMVK
jgi:hypothetical protein